jgi:hypothetical protein
MDKFKKYSNVHKDRKKDFSKIIKTGDRTRLRDMAERWIKIILSDDMQKRMRGNPFTICNQSVW